MTRTLAPARETQQAPKGDPGADRAQGGRRPLAPDVVAFLHDEAAKLCSMVEEAGTARPVSEAPATWLDRIALATAEAEEEQEAARIEAQLASQVITEEYRLRLVERRAELQALAEVRRGAAWQLDLLALRAEAERRQAVAAQATSLATSGADTGPASVTVPLSALLPAPEPVGVADLFAAVRADPSGANVAELTAQHAVGAYLDGRLDWPVTVELVEPGDGTVWFQFTVAGQALVVSRSLDLPLEALDAVFPESLQAVTTRAAAIAEAATLDAAFDEMERTIREAAQAIADSPEDYALNEVMALNTLAQDYRNRLGALAAAQPAGQAWLAAQLLSRRDAFAAAGDAMIATTQRAQRFHDETMPGTYAGETYDRLVSESEYLHEEYGWRAWRFLGNVFTLGGQSEGAENARAYRRGEISLSDYKTNYWLAIGRVGVRALTAALPVGRATGPALRFLGLGGEGAAAQIGRLGADYVASSFVESLASDAYSKAAALLSGSHGVAAFQERQIAGIGGWIEGLGWGSAFMTAFGAGGRAWQGYRAAAARRGAALPPGVADRPALPAGTTDQPAVPEVRGLRITDAPNGDFAFFVEDSVSGKRLLVQGNRLTGEATVVDPANGGIVASLQGGEVTLQAGVPPVADIGPTPPAAPRAAAAAEPVAIDALIRTELPESLPGGAEALDPAAFGPTRRPTVRSLKEVDLSDMPTSLEAQYVARYPEYVKEWLATGQLPPLGNFRDYVRFRYGLETGQIVRGGPPVLGAPGGSGGMHPAAVRGIAAGNVAEQIQSVLRETGKNTRSYSVRFWDPIRGKTVAVTVIPDFMPAARRQADGRFATARDANDAVLIADSKYTWDESRLVGLDSRDQIRGMLWLARSATPPKPFVFLLGEGPRGLAPEVYDFARAIGVEVHAVNDVSGLIR
jgi:hypothetical protein